MIRFLLFFSLMLLALFLQGTWLFAWPAATLRFEWVWIGVLYLAFTTPAEEGSLLVLLVGLVEDLWASPFIGFFASIYLFYFALIRIFIAHLYYETLWARLLWVGVISVFATMTEAGLLGLMGRAAAAQSFLMSYGFIQSGFNMLVAAVCFPLLDRLQKAVISRK